MKYLYAFLLVVGLASCSKEDSAKAKYKEQYTKIAETIAAQIPSNSRVSLKLTSPDKNGLPEAFLRKLMAEFSGALVQSSKSRFQILNRNSTEEIWQEAVEFNNQDVAKISKSAGADVSVMLSPKINEEGIDLSVTAYSLKEESMGIVLASASELIPMNVKSELGIDISNLNQQVDKLTKLVDKGSAVKENELSKIFRNFAHRGAGWTDLAYTYQEGCQKPERFEDELDGQGLRLTCEIYNDGELVRGDNELLERTIDISLLNADSGRSFVGAIRIKLFRLDGNLLKPPNNLDKFTTLLYCDSIGSAQSGERFYKISIPNEKNPTSEFYNGNKDYYVRQDWSGGSGGTESTIYMSEDEGILPTGGSGDYVKAGDHFLSSEYRCVR